VSGISLLPLVLVVLAIVPPLLWNEGKRNFKALEELCFRADYHKIKRCALGAEEICLGIFSNLPMK
jgi:hypothetical protein